MKKKKETSPPKPKDFSVNPFGALKGLKGGLETAVEKERKAAKPAVEPKPTAPSPDDASLFFSAVAGVKPLNPLTVQEKTKPAPKSAPKPVSDEEKKVFLHAVEKLELDVRFEDELPDDVEPLRPAITSRLRQLKKGAIRIDLELDLHGLTRDEALEELAAFVTRAYARGQKAVLVITGKGNNSPEEPVLLGAVSAWLRDKGRTMVAEFSPAPRQLGGGGAFVLFLKDKEKAKG